MLMLILKMNKFVLKLANPPEMNDWK